MSQLVQYLLAYRKSGGGRIARMGIAQTTVPIFPAGLTVIFDLFPAGHAYANLYFYSKPSPSVVPGVFNWSTSQEGMDVQVGIVRDMLLSEGREIWLEVTQAQPIRTIITNTSNLNQFMETVDMFLIVDTEEDMNEVRRIVNSWGHTLSLEALIAGGKR